jgi:hypothetical protein
MDMITRLKWGHRGSRMFSALSAGILTVSLILGTLQVPAGTAHADASAAAANSVQLLEADYGTSAGALIRTEQFNNTNYTPLPVHAVDELKGIKTKVVRDFVKINWYYNKDAENPDLLAYSINTPENLATNPDLQHGRQETYDFMSQFTDSILLSLAYSYAGDTNPGKNRLLKGEAAMNWPEFDAAMITIIRTLKEKNPKVEYIEAGNEPNLEPAYYGHEKNDIPGYMRMYEGMSNAVLAVNRELGLSDAPGPKGVRLKVGGPVLSGYDFAKQKQFVDIAYANGYHVDFVSWHRYRTQTAENETQETEMKSYLQRYYPEAVTVVSEYGWKGGGGLADSTGNTALAKQAAFMTDSAYFYEKGGTDIPMNWVAVHTLNAYFKNQFDVDYALSNGAMDWQTYDSGSQEPVQYLNLRGWRESATSKLMKIREIELLDAAGQKIAIPNTASDPSVKAVTDGIDGTEFLQSDYWAWLRFDLGSPQAVSKVRIKWGNTEVNQFQLIGTPDKLHYYELLGKTYFTPYFNTMRMLARLGNEKVAATGGDTGNTGVRLLATKNSESKATMLVWNHQLDGTASRDVAIQVKNLPSGFQGKSIRYKKYLVDATHSNYAYNKRDALETVAQGTMNMTGQELFSQTLDPNAVMLLELEAVDSSINNVVSAAKTVTGDLVNPEALVDGNSGTAAVALDNTYPKSVVIDLGKEYYLTGAEVQWTRADSRGHHYALSTSLDNQHYAVAADATYGEAVYGNSLHWFNAKARYVKLEVTGSTHDGPLSIDGISVFTDALYKNGFETAGEQDTTAWSTRGCNGQYTSWGFGTDSVTGSTYILPQEIHGDLSDNVGFFGNRSWQDYGVEARLKVADSAYTGNVEMGIAVRAGGTAAGMESDGHYYFRLERTPEGSRAVLERRNLGLSGGYKQQELKAAALPSAIDASQWYTLRLEAVGSALTGYVNGERVLEYQDRDVYEGKEALLASGMAGLRSRLAKVQFDDVRVYPVMPLLGSILVNGAPVPGFDPYKNEYTVKLPASGPASAVVTGSVFGNAHAVVYPSSGEIPLGGVGDEATYLISAQSTEGHGSTYYKVVLRKASEDATLSSLKLSVIPDNGVYNPGVLAPGNIILTPGQYEYNIKVPSRTAFVSVVEALPTASNLAVTEITHASLAGGAGTATVKVTAEAGNTQVYKIHMTVNPEAPAGALLYQEDFENGVYNQDPSTGWKNATVEGTRHLRVVSDVSGMVLEKYTNENRAFTVGESAWTNYEVRARVKAMDNTGLPGIIARASDDGQNFYMLRIHNDVNGLAGGSTGFIALGRVVNGSLKEYTVKKPFPYEPGKWYQLRLVVNGKRIMGYADDKLVYDVTDNGTLFPGNPAPLVQGKSGIRIANRPARVDDFTVSRLPGDNPEADTQKPVITLLGEASVTVRQNSVYTDAGATASDNRDGNLTAVLIELQE